MPQPDRAIEFGLYLFEPKQVELALEHCYELFISYIYVNTKFYDVCLNRVRVCPKFIYLTHPFLRGAFCGSFLLFMFLVCQAFLSVHCSLVVTCWERANLLALLCVMFYCVFVTHVRCPGSGVVLDCIDFLSLPPYLLCNHIEIYPGPIQCVRGLLDYHKCSKISKTSCLSKGLDKQCKTQIRLLLKSQSN